MGSCVIPTEELLSGEPVEGWYALIVGCNGKTHGAVHIMAQFFPLGALPTDFGKILHDGYFEPKTDNHVRLYMTADTPQLPVFEAGLAIKNPPKKTHLKTPNKNVLFLLFLFLIFYENNTNFSL